MKKENLNNIIELKRRMTTNSFGAGVACGPMGYDAVDAEIIVLDNGNKVYLHGEWVSENPDGFLLEATTESIFNLNEQLNDCSDDEFDKLIADRERIRENAMTVEYWANVDVKERYKMQYAEILKILANEMVRLGYEF